MVEQGGLPAPRPVRDDRAAVLVAGVRQGAGVLEGLGLRGGVLLEELDQLGAEGIHVGPPGQAHALAPDLEHEGRHAGLGAGEEGGAGLVDGVDGPGLVRRHFGERAPPLDQLDDPSLDLHDLPGDPGRGCTGRSRGLPARPDPLDHA